MPFFLFCFFSPSFLLHRRSWGFVSRNRWLRPVSFLRISLIRFAAVNSKPIVEKPSTRRGISLNGDIVACFSTMFLTFDKENYENSQRYLFANVFEQRTAATFTFKIRRNTGPVGSFRDSVASRQGRYYFHASSTQKLHYDSLFVH